LSHFVHLSGTGLFRDQNQVFTKVFDVAATNLLKVGETTHWGGGALEYMVCVSNLLVSSDIATVKLNAPLYFVDSKF
jgi:hypothetical protein